MTTVAITRPKGETDGLSEILHRHGLSVIHEPLSHIALCHTAQPMLAAALEHQPDAVLVTSRHGVRAMATLTELRDLSLLCVGEATASVAASAGFDRVAVAGGTTEQMIEYILSSYDAGSRFVYVSADQVRRDLAEIFSRQGMPTQRVVAYEAVESEKFSDVFAEKLKRGDIDVVTFLSQRAAKTFMALADKAKLGDALGNVTACCFSQDITDMLPKKAWKHLHASKKPTLASLADCVNNAA